MTNFTEVSKSVVYESSKRILDILFSVILLVIFLPVILIVMVLIKLDSPGPIFAETPKRVGENGRLFKMYKFRSMVQNSYQLLRDDPNFEQLYREYKNGGYKLKNDPRVTKFGHFIRKYSLDELPQFFNILEGDMSLVGPRAYYPDELEEQQKRYPETRDAVKIVLSIKPGLTGYWQVSGRSKINFEQRINMDAQYVRHRSLWYDLTIILLTPWAMISGKNAL